MADTSPVTPIVPSDATQQLISAAGQAAADDQAAAGKVTQDQTQIGELNQQLTQVGATLSGDQQAASQADAANNAAYIAACQSLAKDFGVPLPQTIPAAAPPPA